MKVTFLGAGVYGRALGDLAESNGHEVRYYDPYKFPEIKLNDVVKDADLLVFAAPGSAMAELLPELPTDTPLLCVSKGIVTPYPFREFKKFYALAGAAYAEDIATDTPRFGDKIYLTASTPLAEELFTAPKIQVQYFEDTRGIMLCAALKVATSIYAGFTHPDGFAEDTLDEKLPSRQDFLAEMLPEWEAWLDINGCSRELIKLSCGFPDVILSSVPTSRNFAYGQEFGRTGQLPKQTATTEGITVMRSFKNYPDLKIPENSILMEFAKKVC